MRRALLSVAFIGGAVALAPAAQAQPAGERAVQSCYGSAVAYNKPAGYRWYPASGYFTTKGNCNDINMRPNATTRIAVCFLPSSGGTQCQTSFKTAPGGVWTVVATDVKTGTHFYFDFGSTAASSGVWAS